MKIAELRKKPKKSLEKILWEKKERLRSLHFDLAAGKVKNVREIRQIKRDIARLLTLLKEQRTENKEQKLKISKKIK